jgi:diguanylate cyclase (GGDEF)-like protein
MKSAVHISRDTALIAIVERLLSGFCRTIPLGNIQSGLDYIYSLIPDLLIIDLAANDPATVDALNTIKEDPIFTHLPTLALIDDSVPLPRWDDVLIEDYVWKSQVERDLRARAELCVVRAQRVVEVNPLTRLPGNISINRAIQKLIDRSASFGVGYADLDNFKPYNDHYGFARGDEVIKMTGRLILNIVKNRQKHGSFVGHIGGDDFIFIMEADIIEAAAADILATFDRIIATFYDESEKADGIIALDRQGNSKSFPLMTISIGVTTNSNRRFSHYGEMTEAVSEMKVYAKRTKGSCYRTDKRRV